MNDSLILLLIFRDYPYLLVGPVLPYSGAECFALGTGHRLAECSCTVLDIY